MDAEAKPSETEAPSEGVTPEAPEKVTFESIGVNQGETIEVNEPGKPENIEKTRLLRPADKTERAELQKKDGVDEEAYFVGVRRGSQKPEDERWGFVRALNLKAFIDKCKKTGKEVDVVEPSAKEQEDLERWQRSTKLRQEADAMTPKNEREFDQQEDLYRRAAIVEEPVAPNDVEHSNRVVRYKRHKASRAIEFFGQVDQKEPDLDDDDLRRWRTNLGNARKDSAMNEINQNKSLSVDEKSQKIGQVIEQIDAELKPKFLQKDYARMQRKLAEAKKKGLSLDSDQYTRRLKVLEDDMKEAGLLDKSSSSGSPPENAPRRRKL